MSEEEENEYIEKISRELDTLIYYKNTKEITATEIMVLKQPIWLIFADLLNKIRRKDADIQRLQELLNKSDANNIELQQEIESLKNDTYWKGYIDKQNQDAELCKECKNRKELKKKDQLIDELVKYMASGKCYYGSEEEIREVFGKKVEKC